MHLLKLIKLTGLISFCLLGCFQVTHAWSGIGDGIVISDALSNQLCPRVTSDSHGGGIITWEDFRNTTANPSAGTDIYAQAIDSTGVAKWTANGIPVCVSSYDQNTPLIVSDNADGAIIAWYDNRNNTGIKDIYAQAIDKNGNVRWTQNGVAICSSLGIHEKFNMIADGLGGAIITWQDWRNTTGTLGMGADIYVQAVNKEGAVKWKVNGVSLCKSTCNQTIPQLSTDGSGGAIIVWQDARDSTGSHIYAQAISSTGNVKWQPDGIVICTTGGSIGNPCIASDSQGGAYITWTGIGNGFIRAQSVKGDGDLKWNLNGIAINTVSSIIDSQIVPDGFGGAIIAWVNFYKVNEADIYVQRIDNWGNIKWGLNGVAICTAVNYQFRPQILPDGSGGAIISWDEERYLDGDIYAQYVDSYGTTRWVDNGIGICTVAHQQELSGIITDGNGGAIIVWEDGRYMAYHADIYAQDINDYGANVRNVTAVPGDKQVVLSWSKSIVKNYQNTVIVRNSSHHPSGVPDGVLIYYDAGTTFTDTAVINGKTYYYGLFAVNNVSNYASGIRVSATPRYNKNVQNVQAITGNKQLTLTWTNPAGADYMATKIMRRSDRYPTGPTDGIQVYWYNGTISVDTGVVYGQTYYYGLFAHDTSYSFATGYFVSAYLNWQSNEGDFDYPADTTSWGFQRPGNVNQIPSYSWLSSYNGRMGILKLNYSNQTEGLKLTSIARLSNGAASPWYRLRVQYASEAPNEGHEITSQILSSPSHLSNVITEVGGNWTGNGQMVPNRWYTYDTYVYSKESSQQLQLILRNNGSNGAFYIDSIQCDSTPPPATVTPISVPVTIGYFDSAADTSQWVFQNTPDGINGKGTRSWESSVGTQYGLLALNFDHLYQGVKITSNPTYTIESNWNAVMSFKYRSNLSSPTTLHVLGYLYGESDVATFKVDLAGKGVLGNFPGNQWNTMYVPLTSVSGNTSFRLQLVVKNNAQTPETVYIDEVELVYATATFASRRWVCADNLNKEFSLFE